MVAHNASFDCSVLAGCLDYYGLEQPNYLSLCTVKTSRKLFPEFPNHKLNTVCENLNITLNNHHDALEDSRACAEILLQQEQRFGVEPLKISIGEIIQFLFPAKALSLSVASWQEITSFLYITFPLKQKFFRKDAMMYSILYLFTDSLKMRGAQNQFSTLILIFIISFLTFSALLLTLLFSRWLSQMILLDNYAVIPP